MIEQAVILAAGRGSRMGSLGDAQAKCLVEVDGRSLLEWNLRALAASGIANVLVVTGWQADSVADAAFRFAEPLGLRLHLTHNARWADTGPLRSLQCAAESLANAASLMLYGDCAYATRTLSAACAGYQSGLRVPGDRLWSQLWTLRFDDPLLDAERWRSHGEVLQEIGGRAESLRAERAQFMGLLLVDPPAWARVEARVRTWQMHPPATLIDRLDITALLARLLADGEPITCVELAGGWIEVDSQQDLSRISHAWRTASAAHPFAHRLSAEQPRQ